MKKKKTLTVYAVAAAVKCDENMQHSKLEEIHEDVRLRLIDSLKGVEAYVLERYGRELQFVITE